MYRLKQIDLDATFTYSSVVNVTIGKATSSYYTVYPNPVRGNTFINSTSSTLERIKVTVVDNNGKELMHQTYTVNSSTPARVELKGIAAGTYFIRVKGKDRETIEKIVLY